ncbi:uncharacterized protein LOC117911206 [Vitis riparia]|uniref:uncharacterized protein LOC117911206 n=1 Tax=Vitis riparia TaxID=96939 RepID=UPI00155AD8EE|nr:uncharacterized protein LOC117911206 [Vitis riparia]
MMNGLRRKKIPSSSLIFVGFKIMSYLVLMPLELSSNSQETETSSDHMVSSHSYKRKHNEGPSTSGGKGKEKELNLTPIDEDEDLHEMGIHDSGHFPTIDTLDEDDDDLEDEDLS